MNSCPILFCSVTVWYYKHVFFNPSGKWLCYDFHSNKISDIVIIDNNQKIYKIYLYKYVSKQKTYSFHKSLYIWQLQSIWNKLSNWEITACFLICPWYCIRAMLKSDFVIITKINSAFTRNFDCFVESN